MSIYMSIPMMVLLLFISYTDIRDRIIPNRLILPAFLVAISMRLILQDISFLESILGLLFAGGIFFIGAWVGKVGGGDVKLMALVGFVLGFWNIWMILILISIFLLATWMIVGNKPVPFAPYVFFAVVIHYLFPYQW